MGDIKLKLRDNKEKKYIDEMTVNELAGCDCSNISCDDCILALDRHSTLMLNENQKLSDCMKQLLQMAIDIDKSKGDFY